MRYLLVVHGPALDPARPVSGGVLRAEAHARALQAAGHTVTVLRRAQDEPGGYASPADLRRKARQAAPDAIVCVAPEEAPALRGLAPLCVDLYAPRMLEAAWEGLQGEQAEVTLRAVDAADQVLYSNPRQRWFHLGILGLAGWDLAGDCGRVVPLACLPDPDARPAADEAPYVVLGGQRWPWQDPGDALRRAVAHLQGRAEVRVYGPASGVPGVREMGTVGRRDWLAACAGAAAVVDRYAPHQERELALSFRQLDALAAGTPLISDSGTPIAAGLRAGAGWVDESLEDALDAALGTDGAARRAAVPALAAQYALDVVAAPLLAWTPVARARGPSVVRAATALADARARAEAERTLRQRAEAEVDQKRAEVDGLHAQVRALCGAVEANAAALADVAAFRREAVNVLGARLAGADSTRESLQRQIEELRADRDKKSAELDAMTAERDRLNRVFRWRR